MVRAVVIGCGRMGAQPREVPVRGWMPIAHTDAVKAAGFDLVAVCDVDEGRLTQATQRLGCRGYRDYAHMIHGESPDLVMVATRTPEKRAIVAACADVPHIYVEKPLAYSIADCRQMLSRPIAYGVNRRYHGMYRWAKDHLSEIGELRQVAFEFGRSALLWTHAHTADLAVFFLGQPIAVHAITTNDGDPIVEFARIECERGTALITQGHGCTTRLYGTRGTMTIHADGSFVEIDTGTGYLLSRETILSRESIQGEDDEGATVTALRELVRGRPIAQVDVLASMQILLACAWSKDQHILIRDVPEDFRVSGLTPYGYA